MLDLDYARSLLSYDPETGDLRWRRHINSRAHEGAVAGCIYQNGYRVVVINKRRYKASRLAWFIHFGGWPYPCVDHKNGDRLDDRLCNLRQATHKQNSANLRRSPNKCGFMGVRKTPQGAWRADIKIDGRSKCLGIFHLPELAHAAYVATKTQYAGEFAKATYAR